MAVAFSLLSGVPEKDKQAFIQGYINSEYRKKLLELVTEKYSLFDRPSVYYDDVTDPVHYAFRVAHYDGRRAAYEEIMRLLDV